MPIIVRGADIAAEQVGSGVIVQSLLSPANTGSNNVLLDLITFEHGATFDLVMTDDSFGWLQVTVRVRSPAMNWNSNQAA